MNLIIKVEQGKPVGHPVFLENFARAFPGKDPFESGYVAFVRVPAPRPGKYEIATGKHRYDWSGGVVTDIWETREMTPEEKAIVDSYDQFETE